MGNPISRRYAVMAGILLLLSTSTAWADRAQYRQVRDLKQESATLTVEHHHDWSTTPHLSSLRAVDRLSGRELFNQPSPALTYLWISPDGLYIVGLSTIRLANQYQLMLWNRSGQALLSQDMTLVDWASTTNSVSNWINWYRDPAPRISIDPEHRALMVEDYSGVMRAFFF